MASTIGPMYGITIPNSLILLSSHRDVGTSEDHHGIGNFDSSPVAVADDLVAYSMVHTFTNQFCARKLLYTISTAKLRS
eukprot:scaffold1719_cov186-Amphora_coffeaeformis.AAC.1